MGSRQYGQACSLAYALDRIGERWTLLIVRELSLGPMRFSALVRAVGGAPTDILTKRLRELEQHGVVRRRELEPPASATVYELTALGRGLERPMVELGRWGMGLQELDDVIDLAPSSLPSAMRVILQPPRFKATLGLRTDGDDYWLRIEDGWTTIGRGAASNPDLFLNGTPVEVIATLVVSDPDVGNVVIEGDRDLLERLRTMVVIPDRLRRESEESAATLALSPA